MRLEHLALYGQLRDGVFAVSFWNDTMLYGSYGGSTGKPARVTDFIVYGDSTILLCACQQSPVIIQLQSATLEPVDGVRVFSHDLYSRVLDSLAC